MQTGESVVANYIKHIEFINIKMKRECIVLAVILLVIITGCGGRGKQSTDDLITFDVTKSYPQKELILQDFMDVEYIVLETTDDFLTQGLVLDIGKEIILVRNLISDGDIFVYDRNGKGLRKINRMGQGPEEYENLIFCRITLDEENNELFINNTFTKRISVYDLYGNFVRSFSRNEGANYSSLQNFDRLHLIGRETAMSLNDESTESQPFAIISKNDGSMVHDIRIRFEQGINTMVTSSVSDFMMTVDLFANTNTIIPFRESWILVEYSSDTIFRLLSDLNKIPFMARSPSVHSTNPEILFLPILFTDRYFFLETFKKEIERVPGFFRKQKLVYDRQENTIYNYTVVNSDYSTKKTLDFSAFNSNKTIAFWQKLEPHELIELNKKGELKGTLKEIASKLNEEDNPVIMLVKHKQ